MLTSSAQTWAEEKSADELAVESIRHPAGLELSLWADSLQLANPVAFTFDHQGRMYVCETFRQNKGVEDNRGHMSWLDDDLAAQSVEDRLAYFQKHLQDGVSAYAEEEDRICGTKERPEGFSHRSPRSETVYNRRRTPGTATVPFG